MPTPLFELDGVNRFSDRADAYALGRPSYPLAAIDWALQNKNAPRVLDAGAGTGIGTRLLRERGARTIALDPNLAMLATASDVRPSVCGAGETLPFTESAFDVVTSFNAFHWMKPDPALREMRRVLRPDGHLALIWNDWDASDPFTAQFVEIMRSYAGDHPPEDRAAEVAPLFASPYFEHVVRRDFANRHLMSLEQLRARVASIGYLPRQEPLWSEIQRRFDELYARHADPAGRVTHHYVTCVFLSTPVATS